jgi:hypothetical protein
MVHPVGIDGVSHRNSLLEGKRHELSISQIKISECRIVREVCVLAIFEPMKGRSDDPLRCAVNHYLIEAIANSRLSPRIEVSMILSLNFTVDVEMDSSVLEEQLEEGNRSKAATD